MLAILKGIPFCFSLLMEIFKTHEGGNVKPATKLIVLSFAAFLTYSTYITLVYIEQYHIMVKQQYHVEYLNDLLEEKRALVVELKQDRDELEGMLRLYRVPPPSYNQPDGNPGSPAAQTRFAPPKPEPFKTLDPEPTIKNEPMVIPEFLHPSTIVDPMVKKAHDAAVMFRRERKEEEK